MNHRRGFEYPIVSEITPPRHKITRDTFLDNLNEIVLPEAVQQMGQLILFPTAEIVDLGVARERAALRQHLNPSDIPPAA